MTPRILAAASPGEVRVAVVGGDGLLDYALWRPGAPDGVGDVHVGRIIAMFSSLAGAFVALADGAEGFLPDTDGAAGQTEGALVAVRVTRAAQGGKGPRLSMTGVPQGPALVLGLRQRGPGALARLAALHPAAPVLLDDPALLAGLRPTLGERLTLVARAFDDATEAMAAELAETSVDLPGGGRMHVHPTPALVAIDLDTGGDMARRQPKSLAQRAVNRAAIPVLARQIRLRNLAGAILVDFAGMPARARAALAPELAAALASDPLRPRLLGFTGLGLAEIVRPRVHPPLHELLAGPHAAGLAALRQLASEAAANPAATRTLRTTPAIAAAVQKDAVARADLAGRTGRPLILKADPALSSGAWTIEETTRA